MARKEIILYLDDNGERTEDVRLAKNFALDYSDSDTDVYIEIEEEDR